LSAFSGKLASFILYTCHNENHNCRDIFFKIIYNFNFG